MDAFNQGYEILNRRDGDGKAFAVLGHNPASDFWVTWLCVKQDDGELYYYAGHYTERQETAQRDFQIRDIF